MNRYELTLNLSFLVAGLAGFLLVFRKRFLGIAISAVAFFLCIASFGVFRWQERVANKEITRQAAEADLPILGRDDQFVSSQSCRACHPAEYASWHQTYHRSMTQVATPKSVLGDFSMVEKGGSHPPTVAPDGAATVNSHGQIYRIFQQDGEYFAEMPNPELMMYALTGGRKTGEHTYLIKRGPDVPIETIDMRTIERVTRKVVMTTGSHHYQTYWVPGDDRYRRLLQTLPLVWLKSDQRWIPREAAFMQPPDARMITQWNHHCISCHSTGGIPGLQYEIDAKGRATNDRFETQVAELGIACEACHGPGGRHVALNRDPLRRYQFHLSDFVTDDDDLVEDQSIVNPARLDHRRSSQVCGQCHGVFIREQEFGSKFAKEGIQYLPGEDLHEKRYYVLHPQSMPSPERWQEYRQQRDFYRERWWEDGTMLAGGREYTALMASPCYQQGEISCLSCHSMHHSNPDDQLKPGMRGSKACTQCHDEPRYSTELLESGVQSHTHHRPESTGSNCLNCHMPRTTYALFSAIRNHQIGSPKLSSAVKEGVPHACNLCHLDKTLHWTQTHVRDWYGAPAVSMSEEHLQVSAAVLWMIKGDAAQRAIVAWHARWEAAQEAAGAEWLPAVLAPLLADPYGVVRYVASKSLMQLPQWNEFPYDFLADKATLRQQVANVWQRWQEQSEVRTLPPALDRQSVMLREDGTIDTAAIRQMLPNRNDRPVHIKE